jgi:dihydrofolate reductase
MAPAQSRQLSAFMHVSIDGYFCDPRGDISFAHKPPDDAEWHEFVAENAAGSRVLVFGRTTYDIMAGWWPTPAAAKAMPEVAAQMNAVSKIVFSRTLTSVHWNKTTLIKKHLVPTISRMKVQPGPDMAILGSGSVVTQLADAGLIDTIQMVVNPVALGAGKSFLAGLRRPLNLALTHARTFENGSVVLWYAGK